MKQEIRKLLGTDKIIIGTDRTIKALAAGKLKRVILAGNCDLETVTRVQEIAGKASIEKVTESNEELGVMCKKPFRIAVIGLL